VRRTLAEALGIDGSSGAWYAWRDHQEGLEYLAPGAQLAQDGFRCRLSGYQARVLLDFRRLDDTDGRWSSLASELEGRGVPDLQVARRRRELAPQLALVRSWMTPAVLGWLEAGDGADEADDDDADDRARQASVLAGLPSPLAQLALRLRELPDRPAPITLGRRSRHELQELLASAPHSRAAQAVYLAAVLREAARPGHGLPADAARLVAEDLETSLHDWLGHDFAAGMTALAARLLAAHPEAAVGLAAGRTDWMGPVLDDPAAAPLLGIHEHDGTTWFVAEHLDALLLAVALAALAADPAADPVPLLDARGLIRDAARDAGWQLGPLRRRLGA